jgi:[protein-PII] uridylyltransferase
MHRSLYRRTLEQFEDGATIAQKRKDHISMLHQQLTSRAIEGIPEEEIEAHFSLLPERYFINTDQAEIELHLRMVNRLLAQIQSADSMGSLAPIIDWHDDIDLGMTVVNVVTWDRAGLFYKLAGALTLAGVNIVSTKAISRKDHITIDTFFIMDTDGGIVTKSRAREIFEQRLTEALIEERELMPEINEREAKVLADEKKKKDLLPAPFPPSVDVYHELSLKQTIIEVQAGDRVGLLYQISRFITKMGFDISFARIATERGVAMDTFYIKNDHPGEATDTTALLELREGLDRIVRE